jgi:hypothetical protein
MAATSIGHPCMGLLLSSDVSLLSLTSFAPITRPRTGNRGPSRPHVADNEGSRRCQRNRCAGMLVFGGPAVDPNHDAVIRIGSRAPRWGTIPLTALRPCDTAVPPQTGVRESAPSWRELLIDIKRRGLEIALDLAVGDGALGFWKAVEEVFPGSAHQRCWVHKTANVLNKVALSVQVNMKADLRENYGASTRAAAESAIDVFVDKYGAKYEKAVACLIKDRDALLAFFDFPAEHGDHLRTSNPIESVFATVRHRTVRSKGSLSAMTAKLMVFKLVTAAASR